jgi:hypothetical protein
LPELVCGGAGWLLSPEGLDVPLPWAVLFSWEMSELSVF